jgi:outer membrane protein assembly factor BamE (lipoprotein component of BamABCDE complex)
LGLAAFLVVACGTYRSLTAANVSQVKVGDSTEQVKTVLGPPMSLDSRDRSGQIVWTYSYYDGSQFPPNRLLYLNFDPTTGKLVRSETAANNALDPSAGGGGGGGGGGGY